MAAPFAIDPATGRIRFPDLKLEIGPQMPEAEFIAATARLNRDNLGANDGWQRYSLNGRLSKASFAYNHKDDTWANWSEEKDAANQREYQQQVDAQLGGKQIFPWGRISVLADSKSGGIEIWIDYGEQSPETRS
jgi:hypothetical protein